MNKNYTEYFTALGMSVNGNQAYGVVRGYEVNAAVVNTNSTAPLQIHISFYAADEQKRNIESALRNAQIKFLKFQFTPYGLFAGLTDITMGKLLKRLPELMDAFFSILAQCGARGDEYCPVCGEPFAPASPQEKTAPVTVQNESTPIPSQDESTVVTAQDESTPTPSQDESTVVTAQDESTPTPSQDESTVVTAQDEPAPVPSPATLPDNKKRCVADGYIMHLHPACVENINAVIEAENKDFEQAPNNCLRGFCGALIGGLAGAAVAVILYMIGFYSSIAAVVSVVLGSFLYRKFHGKPNKTMLVIVSLTTVVCMMLSVFLIYFTAAGTAAVESGVDMSATEAFLYLMDKPEFAKQFYIDLVMVLLFSAIGIGVQIAAMAQTIKRKKTIR